LWAVGLVFSAALFARRWRLARDLLLAGVVAWATARLIGTIVVTHSGLSASLHAVVRLHNRTPTFPFVRLSVVVAVVVAAAPYLTRWTRRIGQVLVISLALAALYLGVAYPNDIVAAILLGWGVGAGVHLAFGSPAGRPTPAQVAACLVQLGVSATGVRLAPRQPAGATLMLCEDERGPLVLKVIGRDEADAQFLGKLWRSLFYKDSGPTLFLTRLQQVEHEAYAALRAKDGGVRVPDIITVGTAGPNTALLVARPLTGPLLADVDPAEVTDELLADLWAQVARLHEARLAHGALNAEHIVIADDRPALFDFASSSVAGQFDRRPADVAELLVATASIVGDERAVAVGAGTISAEALTAALPLLQAAALSRETRGAAGPKRKELHARLKHLSELGAAAADTDIPPLEELHRVKTSSLLMAVGMFLAAAALLSQVGDPADLWDTVTEAQWNWLLLAFVLSMSTNIAFAIALMGTVPARLPLWRTSELQVSMSFSNLAVPAVGGMAAQIRFLQKQGADLASAVASGGLLSSMASPIVQLAIFGAALVLTPDPVNFLNVPTSGIVDLVLAVVVVVLIAAGVVFGIPRIRKAALPPLRQAVATVWGALRSPRQLSLLFAGNFFSTIMYGFCLMACIEAFGHSPTIWTLLVANIGVSTVASLVPIPGGSTAVASVGLSGALTAFGVPTSVAVSAVLTQQLVVNYVPAVLGWFATKDLLDRDYL
ncbi:MAG: flippase-like domain-containing protein, partial [Actinomycetota bacterium]|nr:flippase-like domain-containing protein [Actinomycetota bacterium]